MKIYLLTFYLFDEIEKNIKITHANQSATSKPILTKCSCNLNVYIFYLRFALGIIHGHRCDRKNTPKNHCYILTPFSVVEVSNTVTFEEMRG